MIYGVKGRPGGGKTYYANRKIVQALMAGKCVVSNVTLRPDWAEMIARRDVIGRLIGRKSVDEIASSLSSRYHQLDPDDPEAVRQLFRVRISGEKEGRAIAVLDEAHNWLNARTWNDDDRKDIVAWFTQHRKLGFDIYLISQAIESIDAQIRRLIEYHVVLRNLKRWRVGGIPLCPMNMFIAITVWDGGPGSEVMVTAREAFALTWQRKLYDTMGLSHGLAAEYGRSDAIWLPRKGKPRAPIGCVSSDGAMAASLGNSELLPLEIAGFASNPEILVSELTAEGDVGDLSC